MKDKVNILLWFTREESDMSRGIGAHANLVLQDENIVVYEYGGYNLNDERFRNEGHTCYGTITIQKDCFLESEIHEKLKKTPGGKKKLITKRIPVDVNYPKHIEEGLITVENCSNFWETTDDEKHIDVMALHILFKLFFEYQEQGEIPEYISYDV